MMKEKDITDREILENHVELETLWISQKEREEIIYMPYQYRGTFSLRNETGTIPYTDFDKKCGW